MMSRSGLSSVKGGIDLCYYFMACAMKARKKFNSNPLDDLNERQRKIYNELPITFSTAEGLEIAMEYNIPEPSTAPINVAPQSPMALIHTLFIVYYSVYLKDHYPTIYLPNGSLPIIQEMPKQQTYVVMAVAGMVSHSGSIGL